jgi:hypothetical protein
MVPLRISGAGGLCAVTRSEGGPYSDRCNHSSGLIGVDGEALVSNLREAIPLVDGPGVTP